MPMVQTFRNRVLVLGSLMGLLCTACVPPAPPETEILEFGIESKGTLRGGNARTFLLPVEADVRYAISLVGTAGSLGVPDLRAVITGDTAPQEVVWDVRGLSLFRPEVVKGFRALEGGFLEFNLENRTEGLTLEQGLLQFLIGRRQSGPVSHPRIRAGPGRSRPRAGRGDSARRWR